MLRTLFLFGIIATLAWSGHASAQEVVVDSLTADSLVDDITLSEWNELEYEYEYDYDDDEFYYSNCGGDDYSVSEVETLIDAAGNSIVLHKSTHYGLTGFETGTNVDYIEILNPEGDVVATFYPWATFGPGSMDFSYDAATDDWEEWNDQQFQIWTEFAEAVEADVPAAE